MEGMEALISAISPMITQIFSMVTQVGTTIVGTPFLLATFGFLLVGGAVGIFGRLLSRN